MFINDDLSVTFGSSLNRPVYSGSLFCRLLKQTAKENLRHEASPKTLSLPKTLLL